MSSVQPIPEHKRRKLAPFRRSAHSPATRNKTARPPPPPLMNRPTVNVGQISLQEAKNEAVKQAQQEGSTGNFKIFDSPFGNFLLPVIPSPAEFG